MEEHISNYLLCSIFLAIAETLNDANTNAVVVKEVRQSPQNSRLATLTYFNETLPTSECPVVELNNLVKRLDVNRLSDLVTPMLNIKSITGQLIAQCEQMSTTGITKTKVINPLAKNLPPVPRNQVDRVVATAGQLLVYKVPSDTFFDPNDNEVLHLTLKTKENKELSPRNWLQFDTKNKEFYGIPKGGDVGAEEYLLVAEDSGGLTATDALVVQVNNVPKRDFSVYFKVYLAIKHELFNAELQRKFVERIAQLFGDVSTQNIIIRSITTHHDTDGTIVNFYNATLFKSHNRCPMEEIEAVRNVYTDGHTVRDHVKKALGTELNVTNVQLSAFGSCHRKYFLQSSFRIMLFNVIFCLILIAPMDVTHREFIPPRSEDNLLKTSFTEDYILTVILPSIIIVTMVLIAALVAWCLHRRRRKSGKMELGKFIVFIIE